MKECRVVVKIGNDIVVAKHDTNFKFCKGE